MLAKFAHIAAITSEDRQRFISLGASENRVTVNGNLKFAPLPSSKSRTEGPQDMVFSEDRRQAKADYFRAKLGLKATTRVLVAGSTHSGEESLLLEGLKELRPELEMVLLLAPRHLKRLDEIEDTIQQRGLGYCRYSEVSDNVSQVPVIVVDRMGVLKDLYALGDYVFCGGSLVPKGGHNIMEAAAWGIPPMYGPYMDDFRDAAAVLEGAHAALPINSGTNLFAQISYFEERRSQYKEMGKRALLAASTGPKSAREQAEFVVNLLEECI